MLRYLERDGWDCDTACEKVVELVLALASTLESDMITGRYGDPAGWFAGLSGVSSNTVKKLERKLNKAASGPGVQAHQGPLILL